MVAVMRKREQGSWDNTTERWRWRAGGVSMSPKQLASELGIEVPETMQGSRPFWNRFLESILADRKEQRKLESPVKERIKSLEQIIRCLTNDGRDTKTFAKELLRCLSVKAHDIDSCDMPVPHPDVVPLIGSSDNELEIRSANALVMKPEQGIPNPLSREIENQVEIGKTKKGNGWKTTKYWLAVFLESIGDIDITEIKVEHYRKFLKCIKEKDWTDSTRHGCKSKVDQLLKRIEADYNVTFGFVRNLGYRIELPQGNKVQYTIEQVKTAVTNATGEVRRLLLLGLNCGFLMGDIVELNQGHIQNGYLVKSRDKQKHKSNAVVGNWKLWKATEESLKFESMSVNCLIRLWDEFREKHNLPSHKALRKTIAQLIQDHVGETEARLYRCEGVEGTHGKNYIRNFTPEQIRKLDNALLVVGKMIGVE